MILCFVVFETKIEILMEQKNLREIIFERQEIMLKNPNVGHLGSSES